MLSILHGHLGNSNINDSLEEAYFPFTKSKGRAITRPNECLSCTRVCNTLTQRDRETGVVGRQRAWGIGYSYVRGELFATPRGIS